MASSIKDISINTLIGPGTFIRGEMKVAGFVRVDGDIDGDLQASGRIIIGENARIRGDVQGQIVTVGGVVEGDVVAPEGIVILSSGMVIGSVLTKRLSVSESVLLHGYCFAVDDQERFDAAYLKYSNKKALANSRYSASGNRES